MATRTITYTLTQPDGGPWAGVTVTLSLSVGFATSARFVAPGETVTSVADSNGQGSLSVEVPDDGAGTWVVTLPDGAHTVKIPAGPSTTLQALLAETQTLPSPSALAAHANLTTTAHGGIVASTDARLTDARTPTGAAGGVLGGTYPNPSFAVDMATQAELDAEATTRANADTTLSGRVSTLEARSLPALALFWSSNGDIYFRAHEAMTLAASPQEAGTGTLSYAKALNAAPTSFSGTSLPITLAAGDVLRVTCASISGYKAATLSRSA